MPAACAALCASLVMADAVIPAAVASGVTRRPIVSNLGTISRSNPICFVAAMLPRNVAPVTLPPGRLRLATMPDSTGSPPVVNTMGIVAVAALADSAELSPPTAAITATRRRTSSAASAGSRSRSPSAETVYDRNIAALVEAGFAETLAECGEGDVVARLAIEQSNERDCALLRARRERPRSRRAAEERDEIAPLHIRHGDFLPYALSARRPTRALGFPAPQPA